MKFLVLAKPRDHAFEDPLTANKAAKAFLKEMLHSGKLDAIYQRMDGGGVAIANATSAEELFWDLRAYPLSAAFTYHVEPLADVMQVLDTYIEQLERAPR